MFSWLFGKKSGKVEDTEEKGVEEAEKKRELPNKNYTELREKLIEALEEHTKGDDNINHFMGIIAGHNAAALYKCQRPKTYSKWVKLVQTAPHVYKLNRNSDYYTSLSIHNPTDMSFRVYFVINERSALTFYDVRPGHNLFEMFMSDFPIVHIQHNSVKLYVTKMPENPLPYLENDSPNLSDFGDDSKLEVMARVTMLDGDLRNMVMRYYSKQDSIILDRNNGVHVIDKQFHMGFSDYLGKEVHKMLKETAEKAENGRKVKKLP